MIISAALAAAMFAGAENLVHYTGSKLSDPNRHDGGQIGRAHV